MKSLPTVFRSWLIATAIITLICFIIYGAVQQTYRTGANDPQIQMAEDVAQQLTNGADAKTLITRSVVEMASSLSPFTIIYDEQGNALASDATLDGGIPKLPQGVLDFTKQNQQDVVTWQPSNSVRNAIVIRYVAGKGFVMVGRSLYEVENRESALVKQILFGWIFSICAMFVLLFAMKLTRKNDSTSLVPA